MREAIVAWLANPVTGVLLAGFWLVVLIAVATGVAGVIRTGGIQVMGLLSARPSLLPGYPRRGHLYPPLVLFLLAVLGGVMMGWAASLMWLVDAVHLTPAVAAIIALAGWGLAIAVAAGIARGDFAEGLAHAVLVMIRPAAPLLTRLVPAGAGEGESTANEDEDDDEEELDEHEVKAFIGAGEAAGILEREDAELIASVVELADTVAREIMTPRTDIVAVPVNSEFEDLQNAFVSSMFTRLPVYRDTLDRIEGLLHVKDVFKAAAAGRRPSAGELLRPVPVVPETKPLRDLLREFQAERQQLAVVVDEYGGTSGIVTLEDVLEEIVGEIQDEHQAELPEVEEEPDGSFLIAGGAHVEVLERVFGVEVGEVDFDSVAGLVLDRLGHLPRAGETITWKSLRLEAVEVDRRRLKRVRVTRIAE
ncbi:MAG: HlyC/CorC family transporter [Acidobacteriota bacterium]